MHLHQISILNSYFINVFKRYIDTSASGNSTSVMPDNVEFNFSRGLLKYIDTLVSARKLFDELNRDLLGPLDDSDVIVIGDSEDKADSEPEHR
jgi:hypothetical protein